MEKVMYQTRSKDQSCPLQSVSYFLNQASSFIELKKLCSYI